MFILTEVNQINAMIEIIREEYIDFLLLLEDTHFLVWSSTTGRFYWRRYSGLWPTIKRMFNKKKKKKKENGEILGSKFKKILQKEHHVIEGSRFSGNARGFSLLLVSNRQRIGIH